MAKKGGGSGKDHGKDDERLWQHITKNVVPLKGKNKGAAAIHRAPSSSASAPLSPSLSRGPVSAPAKAAALPAKKEKAGREVDRRTDERLRRGQMAIEGRLDLHGMTQAQAQQALSRYLTRAQAQDKRCVLVITGKGRPGKPGPGEEGGRSRSYAPARGILQEKVPEWLRGPPLSGIVLRFHPARPGHGGAGALYVLLRRNRNEG